MTPNLKPTEALSQVVFIHDYIQLVFQHEGFSIYNAAEVVRDGGVIRQGQIGYCDALVSLINQRVTSVAVAEPYKLSLTFESGVEFHVLSGDDATNSPEAYEFRGADNLWIVESNA
jgi:hypothetical protein